MNNVQTTPLVSIIVPIYNTEKYIRDCLDSISTQTYTFFETILVDDGSTDQSGTICDEYAKIDNRFKVIHQENQGVSMARIAAFEHCHGEYITFIDSDDYVTSDYLERLANAIVKECADIVSCEYNRIKNHHVLKSGKYIFGLFQGNELHTFVSHNFLYNRQTKGYGIHPGLATKMIKRDLVEEGLKQGIGLWYGEDTISVFSILLKCDKLVALPDKLYNYVEHDDEAVKRYSFGLWENVIELLQRIDSICHNEGITVYGTRQRFWQIISFTILKMQVIGLSYMSFYNDMCIVRNHPYMKKYFEPWLISKDFGLKGNIAYLLLRLKQYHLFWILKNIKYSNM